MEARATAEDPFQEGGGLMYSRKRPLIGLTLVSGMFVLRGTRRMRSVRRCGRPRPGARRIDVVNGVSHRPGGLGRLDLRNDLCRRGYLQARPQRLGMNEGSACPKEGGLP